MDYLLINFSAGDGEEGGGFGEYYIAWQDVLLVLELEPEKFAASVAAGRETLNANTFETWCKEHGYAERQMFVNIIPIISAAGSACTSAIAQYIQPQSVEAEAFLDIFQTVNPANFARQDYTELTSAVFWPR